MIRIFVCMWPDFCAGRGFNHVRFDKMHDYMVNLDKGERIVLAYTKRLCHLQPHAGDLPRDFAASLMVAPSRLIMIISIMRSWTLQSFSAAYLFNIVLIFIDYVIRDEHRTACKKNLLQLYEIFLFTDLCSTV